METPVQKIINELQMNLNGANCMRLESGLTQLEKNWLNAQIKTLTDIKLYLEVNFLEEEKNQLKTAFDFGMKYGSEDAHYLIKNSDIFFNETYSQSCSQAE